MKVNWVTAATDILRRKRRRKGIRGGGEVGGGGGEREREESRQVFSHRIIVSQAYIQSAT